jgi:hypothetical protein
VALSTVTITWDETDPTLGALSGDITFTLSATLIDATDSQTVHPVPKTYSFSGSSGSTKPLVANDNANVQAGSYYNIVVAIDGQTPYTFQAAINHANGATQTLASLTPISVLPATTTYMPVPAGTAAAGSVPVATGAGEASTWRTLTLNVVTSFGAKGDGVMLADGAVTASSAAFTSASAAFASTDVGKTIAINGAGAAGANLVTTIAAVTSSTSVTLTATAGTTVSGAFYAYGTLNDAAFIAAAAAAGHAVPPAPNGVRLRVPAGVYLISSALNWKIPGLYVEGDGPNSTAIVQTTDNTPVVQVAGQYQRITGMTLTFPYQQSSAQTSGLCMTLGDNTVGSCFESSFENLLLQWGNTGLTLDPNLTVGAGVFSCTFKDIAVGRFSVSAININGNNGNGGAHCTGCVFSNIYITNTTLAATGTATGPVVQFKNWDELVVNQLNIEHSIVSSADVLIISTVGNAVFNSLHFESLTTSVNGQALIHSSNAGAHIINGLTARFNTYSGSGSNAVVKFFGTGLTVVAVTGFNESSNTVTTPSHPLIDFATATNCTATVYGIAASQTTANTVNAGAGDVAQVGAVAIDGTAGDIQPLGTQAAGSTGKAADAGHIHSGSLSNGVSPYSTGFTAFSTGGDANLLNSSSGSSVTPVAGTWYYATLWIPYNCTLTGIIGCTGSAGGTDNWIVALWTAAGGAALANSSLSGIAAPAATTKKAFAFTGTVNVRGPGAYIIGIQSSGTTAKLLCFGNAVEGFATGSVAGSFGTVPSLSPATTYSVNLGPFATTY